MDLIKKKLEKYCREMADNIIRIDKKKYTELYKKTYMLYDQVKEQEYIRTTDFAVIYSQLSVMKDSSCLDSIKELLEILKDKNILEEDAKNIKEALKELENLQKKRNSDFRTNFFIVIKKLRNNQFSIRENILDEHLKKAITDQHKILASNAELAKNTILPLLKTVAAKIAKVDASIQEKTPANLFDVVTDLLPKSQTIEKVDFTKKEASALKVGYEVTLSALTFLSKLSTISSLYNERAELEEYQKSLQKNYDDAHKIYKECVFTIDQLFHLVTIGSNAKLYANEMESIENKMTEFATNLQKAEKEDILGGVYQAEMMKIYSYLSDMQVVWR